MATRGPHLWEITAVRDLFWIGSALLLGGWLLGSVSALLGPVFLGLVLAYLFDPAVTAARRRLHIPRFVTAFVIVALFVAGISFAVAQIVPVLIAQGENLLRSLLEFLRGLEVRTGLPLGDLPRDPQAALESLRLGTRPALSVLQSVVGTSLLVLLWALVLPLSFYLFSLFYPRMTARLRGAIPARNRDRTLRVLGRMDDVIGSFFRGRLIISLIITVFFSAGWFLAGVPYWFILGVVTGLLSMIPYLSGIGLFAAMLVKYIETAEGGGGFDWVAIIVWPTVVFQVVNAFEEYVLQPWIQSKATVLHPLTIFVVAVVGGAAGGLLGLLFAIPAAACVKILYEEVIRPDWSAWVSPGQTG